MGMAEIIPDRNGDKLQRSEYFRQMQKLSRKTYTGSGGFRALKEREPDRFKEIVSRGGKNRWRKRENT